MDVRSGPGIETYTIFRFLDPDSLAILGDCQFLARRFSGPTDTVFTLVASLIDVEVLFKDGDFTENRNTDTSRNSVIDYDPTCEDGTALGLGTQRRRPKINSPNTTPRVPDFPREGGVIGSFGPKLFFPARYGVTSVYAGDRDT